MNEKYVSFSAFLDGELIRLTIPYKELDIVSKDNIILHDNKRLKDLTEIEYEDTYEG